MAELEAGFVQREAELRARTEPVREDAAKARRLEEKITAIQDVIDEAAALGIQITMKVRTESAVPVG